MSEEISSGGKQFLIVLFWSAALYMLFGLLMSMMHIYAVIGGIAAVIAFSALGFFVLTRYSARFTYSLQNGRLRINRQIGKRNKEIDFNCKDIVRTLYGVKPSNFVKHPKYMRISIVKSNRSLYIEYKDKIGELCGVVIEPSEKLRRRIEEERIK